jgi:hypothetical protein
MKLHHLALACAATFAFAHAQAADVEGSTSGAWVNPAPAAPPVVVTGVGTPVFTWGESALPNSLSFRGTAYASPFETPFRVGSISYFNGTTTLGTTPDSVQLALTLDFTNPALGAITSNYDFTLITTTNTADPIESADFVKLPSLFSSTSFFIGSTEYRVKLVGFDNVVGDGFLESSASELHVIEGGTASADLFAIVTTQPVPEPETYALMLAGLAAIGGVVRRRQRSTR